MTKSIRLLVIGYRPRYS